VRRRALLVLLSALLLVLTGQGASSSVLPRAQLSAHGGDVSWPNCPQGMGLASRPGQGLPMPTAPAQFVVLGLTNGPAFTPNPCLASQVGWVRARHLWAGAYAVVSYPTRAQVAAYGGSGPAWTRLYRTGVAEARHAVATMRRAGLRSPMVWVDVEPVGGLAWSRSPGANNALLSGVLAGYRAAGLRTGWYSYAYAWREITGNRRSSLPTWVPSGGATLSGAAARCRQRSFSGGPVWLGQWTASGRDGDITCPGVTRRTIFTGLFSAT
jgi:hypothetical protein